MAKIAYIFFKVPELNNAISIFGSGTDPGGVVLPSYMCIFGCILTALARVFFSKFLAAYFKSAHCTIMAVITAFLDLFFTLDVDLLGSLASEPLSTHASIYVKVIVCNTIIGGCIFGGLVFAIVFGLQAVFGSEKGQCCNEEDFKDDDCQKIMYFVLVYIPPLDAGIGLAAGCCISEIFCSLIHRYRLRSCYDVHY